MNVPTHRAGAIGGFRVAVSIQQVEAPATLVGGAVMVAGMLLALRYLLEIVTAADRFAVEVDPVHHV